MGNIFPLIKTLKQRPDLVSATISLIEKSFGYQSPHSFTVDFAPLIHSQNHENCFILIDEQDQVLAHLGAREVKLSIKGNLHPLIMLGGIAVDEAYRGKGYFNQLMRHVLCEKEDEAAFFLLWSDQEKLYEKFGFLLCGFQFQTPQNHTEGHTWLETNLNALTPEEKSELRTLYQNSFSTYYHTLQRTDNDWELLERIISASLFIRKEDGKIHSYFMRDKGQDLGGIIYEYGCHENLEHELKQMNKYGICWSAHPLKEESVTQFQFMMAPANQDLFTSFIADYSEERIHLRKINRLTGEVFFEFKEETLALDLKEFLRGTLGPDSFEELGPLKPIFISGLDSI